MRRKRTIAFAAFKEHHTELNEIYWSFVPVDHFSRFLARNNPQDSPETLFKASGSDVRRLCATNSEWKTNFGEMANWFRLSLIVAALGYLEVYLRSIIELAIRSDPGLLYGKSKAIDGVVWLKLGITPSLDKEIEVVVKGEWGQRIAAYKKLFGSAPPVLEQNVGRLDALRIVRNGASHTFGRSTDYNFINRSEGCHSRIARLSERSLKRSLLLIEEVASAVDDQLGKNFIGEYEAIAYYHKWLETFSRKGARVGALTAFRKSLTQYGSDTYGNAFCKALISYYESA